MIIICWIFGHNWEQVYEWAGREYRDCLRCGELDLVTRSEENA